jgi:hypothetical protein
VVPANKIDKSIIKVREWILDFNYYGMEGLYQAIAKKNRNKGAKAEIMEQRKKRLIEIIHHKPKYYDINRSSWSLDSLAKVTSYAFLTDHFRSKVATQRPSPILTLSIKSKHLAMI